VRVDPVKWSSIERVAVPNSTQGPGRGAWTLRRAEKAPSRLTISSAAITSAKASPAMSGRARGDLAMEGGLAFRLRQVSNRRSIPEIMGLEDFRLN
jgi:hypothetical protein